MDKPVTTPPILSICIPTYNRAEFLDENLSLIIAMVRQHKLPICISDNGSSDATTEIVRKHALLYEHIHYSRNPVNRGIDYNIAAALKMAETDYAWLFSDDDRFFDGAIERILAHLEQHRPDMIVVNAVTDLATMHPRIRSREDRLYDNMAPLLEELCFHMTWLSTLVWSRELVSQAEFGKYDASALDFIHALFRTLAFGTHTVFWCCDPCIYIAKGASVSWKGRVLEILAKNAVEIILALPEQYPLTSKKKSLKMIGIKTDAFSLHGFYMLKKGGAFTLQSYREYKQYLPYVTTIPMPVCYLLALLPQQLFTGISAAKRRFCP